ncbi:hypothetical protein [[Flexibacter] sp. ATCC 35208]|uniref:hypothetical protein n=1 Tax=[Flexibacter] sp. ATCC 35208 TaxID=1936242 RepID=UPI0009CC5DDA|nr:hypothetical protein [[Flexibacter] sp. ATCC 35208]OMP80073.1 hypothetical protein BW716_06160 [[Flexibacter] sp. ATCC 35208]
MKQINQPNKNYTLADMAYLNKQAQRMNKGNGFSQFLKKNGFVEEAPNIYRKNSPPQLIELTPLKKDIQFRNHLLPEDKGNFIQFIQNRLPDGQVIAPNQDSNKMLNAILVGLYYEGIVLEKRPRIISRQSKGRHQQL